MRIGKRPICRKEAPWRDNPYPPSCSARCRTLDLGAWASDTYRILGEKAAQMSPSDDDSTEPS